MTVAQTLTVSSQGGKTMFPKSTKPRAMQQIIMNNGTIDTLALGDIKEDPLAIIIEAVEENNKNLDFPITPSLVIMPSTPQQTSTPSETSTKDTYDSFLSFLNLDDDTTGTTALQGKSGDATKTKTRDATASSGGGKKSTSANKPSNTGHIITRMKVFNSIKNAVVRRISKSNSRHTNPPDATLPKRPKNNPDTDVGTAVMRKDEGHLEPALGDGHTLRMLVSDDEKDHDDPAAHQSAASRSSSSVDSTVSITDYYEDATTTTATTTSSCSSSPSLFMNALVSSSSSKSHQEVYYPSTKKHTSSCSAGGDDPNKNEQYTPFTRTTKPGEMLSTLPASAASKNDSNIAQHEEDFLSTSTATVAAVAVDQEDGNIGNGDNSQVQKECIPSIQQTTKSSTTSSSTAAAATISCCTSTGTQTDHSSLELIMDSTYLEKKIDSYHNQIMTQTHNIRTLQRQLIKSEETNTMLRLDLSEERQHAADTMDTVTTLEEKNAELQCRWNHLNANVKAFLDDLDVVGQQNR